MLPSSEMMYMVSVKQRRFHLAGPKQILILARLAPHQQGFSLVELAVVLVILGLVAGAITVGANLIRNAELRNTVAELDGFDKGYTYFREKYKSVPGDMVDATDAWGVRAGTGNDTTCRDTKGSYNGTCNGNGDNKVDETNSNSTIFERFLFWQHLSLAGFIDGRYTGASGTASAFDRIPGVNTPLLSIGAQYHITPVYLGTFSGNGQYFDSIFNANTLLMGDYALKPEELWSVDTKIDDGLPVSGKVRSLKASASWSPNCTTSDATSAAYNTTNMTKTCILLYLLD